MFWIPNLVYNKNKLYEALDYWSRDLLHFDFLDFFNFLTFKKYLHRILCMIFKKIFSDVILYLLTKFHCLIAFTSWDIGQYVYCNCLLNSL